MKRTKVACSAFGALGALILLRADSCDGDLLQDPTFKEWCGEELCSWTTEAGAVRRAATWHESDTGVEFVGTPARISQLTTRTATCIEFTAVADVAPEAQVTLTIDLGDDSRADYTYTVPSARFREVKTRVPVAPSALMRVALEKRGSGRAVLAQIRLQSLPEAQCGGVPPVVREAAPNGARAGSARECASGVLCVGRCAACCPYAKGSLCDGETCARACAVGTCEARDGISLCAVPGGRAGAGAACLDGTMCASGTCDGATQIRSRTDEASGRRVRCFDDTASCTLHETLAGTCR
jgi:hypothetical protein